MKKKSFAAAVIASSLVFIARGDGRIFLDTWSTFPYPLISYGDAYSGGILGDGAKTDYFVRVYWAPGVVTITNDPSGTAPISSLGPLTLATGTGSTPQIAGNSPEDAGLFISPSELTLPGVSSGPVTLVVVAYDNPSGYNAPNNLASLYSRGHSAGFQITPNYSGLGSAPSVGTAMPPFSVFRYDTVAPVLTGYVCQPDQSVSVGSSSCFWMYYDGSEPITIRWQHNGTNMPGGFNGSISSVTPGDAGAYSLIATNPWGRTTGYFTLNVVVPQPRIISTALSNATLWLSCTGLANQPYLLEFASSMTPPVVWSDLSTNTSGSNGLFDIFDPLDAVLPERYYRLMVPCPP